MRTIAMYLPQFHRIPENDKWWGEGFTDWIAVKNAKPLFDGHDQPRIPLNNNYYDLLDKNTMEWQADLIHKYGIDGMCIYHYWFGDGRKLLEKPAENLLNWTDIDMPFCFCWANETWARTWSNYGNYFNNAWGDLFEPSIEIEKEANPSGVLIEQKYGSEDEWIKHFEYLLPFFTDKRYICVDDKPVFVIYKATEIECLNEMMECWQKLAKQYGYNGIYIIAGGLDKDISDCVDGVYYRAPTDVNNIWRDNTNTYQGIKYAAYTDVWNEIVQSTPRYAKQPYFMGITGYDASPRRGKEAVVYEEGNPELFEKYLYRLMMKNHVYGSEITFINAWNEWGEGMYLEPDAKWTYAFLEAVRNAKTEFENSDICSINDALAHEMELLRLSNETNSASRRRADANVKAMDRWLLLMENGMDILDTVCLNDVDSVAVYGYGILGKRLCRMLAKQNYNINYIIDKNPNVKVDKGILNRGISVIQSLNEMPEVDCIFVALASDFEEIIYELKSLRKAKCVIPIMDMIDKSIQIMDKGSALCGNMITGSIN